MKRDMELLKEIAIYVENHTDGSNFLNARMIAMPPHTAEAVIYHCELLADVQLIQAEISRTRAGTEVIIERLTFAGHDFVEMAKSPSVWKSAKETITKKAAPFTMEVLMALLKQLTAQLVLGP